MIFHPTRIAGAFVIEPEPVRDERGFFARTYCREEFARHGINHTPAQCGTSFNSHRGTVRGMHYQTEPHAETKLVGCVRGAVYDVIIDLRPDSPTCMQWIANEVSAANRLLLFVPEKCAHGFQTLADDTEVTYQLSALYHPESAAGVRFDDPAFSIEWPLPPACVSERDRGFPLFGREGDRQ